MGLTIHYQLKSDTRSPAQARQLVEKLRQRALDLPFAEVGEVVELKGDACDYESYDREHPLRWLLIQAGQYVERERLHYPVDAQARPCLQHLPRRGLRGGELRACASIPASSTSPIRGRDATASCGRG